VVRSGYTRAKDDNQDPSLCLLHVLRSGHDQVLLTSIKNIIHLDGIGTKM
jgi:hypothetical protein